MEFFDRLDGRSETRFLLEDTGSGRIRSIRSDQLKGLLPAEQQQSLLVSRFVRWPHGSRVKFGLTPFACQYKSQIINILDKYINARRGAKGAPKAAVTERIDSDIASSWEFFRMDGKNTIIMTDDDRFLSAGLAAGARFFIDESSEIYEADLFLKSDHFVIEPRWFSTFLFIHEFGHISGYWHTNWARDFMTLFAHIWSDEPIENERSEFWRNWKMRNKLYYDDVYASSPRITPVRHSVIDISILFHEPAVELIDNLAVTTLKGITGRPLKMEIYSGWLGPSFHFKSKGTWISAFPTATVGSRWKAKYLPSVEQPIVTLQGSVNDRTAAGNIPSYYGSELRLGRLDDWYKLVETIENEGVEERIYGSVYRKALKITLVIEGYMDIESDILSYTQVHTYVTAR
jgi:hypothetical protein